MFTMVQMPLWLLILILLFAVVTFASHLMIPSVRWFFRRRMEKVVARLSAGHAVLGAKQFFQIGHGRLVFPAKAQLDAAQFAVAEQKFQAVAFFQRFSQDALAVRAVEEMILRCLDRGGAGGGLSLQPGLQRRQSGRRRIFSTDRTQQAAAAFLKPVRTRPNLEIITHAQVQRIELDGKRATGVTYRNRSGAEVTIKAQREIVVSAASLSIAV